MTKKSSLHSSMSMYRRETDRVAEERARKAAKSRQKEQIQPSSSSPLSPPSASAPPATGTDELVDRLGALTVDVKTQESRLLQLPLELRQKIYTYLLDTRYAQANRNFSYQPRIRSGRMRLQVSAPPFAIYTAILRTNKQIYVESIHTLYSSNLFVRLSLYNDDIYWTQSLLEGTEMGFVCSNPDLLSKLKRHALDVKIIQERSKQFRCQVVFPVLYLPRFLKFLETMCDALPKWGREHAIHLHLRHKYRTGPAATERLLLEPWRNLHGISEVVVGTEIISAEYAKTLETAMTARFEPRRWLNSLVTMKEMGTHDFSEGNILGAHNHYLNVPTVLDSVYNSKNGRSLMSMPPEFGQEVNRLRFQCELNLALCRLKLCRLELKTGWQDGLLAADNAIDLAEDYEIDRVWETCAPRIPYNNKSNYTAVERSKARFRRASIMMEIGVCQTWASCFLASRKCLQDF